MKYNTRRSNLPTFPHKEPTMKSSFACLIVALVVTATCADDWSQFRGANSNGVVDAKNLPTTWSEDSANIAFQAPISGLGWSSPAIHKNEIWLTTAINDGGSLRAICLHLESGKEIANVEVIQVNKPGRIHSKNSHASPTPIVTDDFVYVHFGAPGTACLKHNGEVVWVTPHKYRMVHGSGGSPILHEGRLYLSCDGGDVQFVIALDAATGKQVWKQPRPNNPSRKKFAFSTPAIIQVNGSAQLVSAGAGGVSSLHPETGKQIWRVDYADGYSVVPQATMGKGLVFVSSAFDRPTLYAIDPTATGNVTDSHVKWTMSKGAPHTPSPLVVGDEIYIVSDRGVATCLNATTGEEHWQERLGGNFSASPVFADGKIYFLNETGETTVVKPGTEYRELAKNQLKGRTLSTPAVIDGALLIRTDTHLVRINGE